MNEDQEDGFESFDQDYFEEDRDSIDTMELLKESSDMSTENAENENENNFENDDIEDDDTIYGDDNDENEKDHDNKPLAIEPKKLDDEYFKNLKDDDEVETSDLDHLEPKLREAWIQMRRLDKKLALATKRERQAKRETLCLIEKNRAELELLRLTSEHKESKLESENTAHFLALTYVDLDNDFDQDLNSDRNSEILTPVFKTQLPDLNEASDESYSLNTPKNETKNNTSSKSDTSSNFTKTSKTKSQTNSNKSKSSLKSQKEQNKNFIQRNIKLAQDAGGALAMTEEEKQRLNEILLDIDNLEDDKEKNKGNLNLMNGDNSTLLVEYNPLSVTLADGDGFRPNQDELEKLKRINTALDKRNYSRNTNSRVSGMVSQTQFNQTTIDADAYQLLLGTQSKQIKLNDDFDENDFGDKFIREARISREQEQRLKYLDSQLEKIKAITFGPDSVSVAESRTESAVSVVSEDQLKRLIDEYYNENSQNIIENGNKELDKLETLREENDLDETENHLPKMNENLIQKLLDDAKNEGLYQIVESNRTPSAMNTERSLYEEALEVIKEREQLWQAKRELNQNEQMVPTENLHNEEKIIFQDQSQMRPVSSKSSINSSNQFLNEEKGYSNTLPPLVNRSDTNELIRDDSRLSVVSSLSSTASSTVLPKIEGRFLPK